MQRSSRFLVLVMLPTIVACAGYGSTVAESGGTVAESVWGGVYSERQAERGAAEYRETCSSCHSEDLRGNSDAPSLIGSSFMFLWADRSLDELFTSIQTLMPTNAPNSLPPQSYLDILAYIMASNGFPAGENELVGDPALLSQILIRAAGL
ncbi:MAG: cytochrome c [Actinobacteria bacterium]|nr:cytochrome c [Actinomycetota bacterium]